MKDGIHPDDYRLVVFQDASADFAILTRSCARTTDTIQWEDGNEYPLIKLDVSSASHPFYTGKQRFLDTAGRVEKFQQRFEWKDDSSKGVLTDAEKKAEERRKELAAKEEKQREKITSRKKANEERRRQILEQKKAEAEKQAQAKAEAEAEAARKAEADKPAEAPKAEAAPETAAPEAADTPPAEESKD